MPDLNGSTLPTINKSLLGNVTYVLYVPKRNKVLNISGEGRYRLGDNFAYAVEFDRAQKEAFVPAQNGVYLTGDKYEWLELSDDMDKQAEQARQLGLKFLFYLKPGKNNAK